VDLFIFASEQWILISVFLMLLYVFAFTERTKGGKPIGSTEVVSLMNSDQAVLVDVRPSTEFQSGHIHGATNIPHTKLTSRISELEKCRSKIIVVADHMGQHAGGAGRALTKEGYNVRRLSGGMAEWQGQKMPMVQGLKE
jgi:rhodanese-related sulfurtransferase